jgi:hypothetical protein
LVTVATRTALLILSMGLAGVDVAHAQPSQASAAATAQFERGRQLVKDGKHKEACEAFEASQRLEAAPGTLYNLAGCYVQIGRLASAHEAYYRLSHSDPNQRRREDSATQAAALAPRVPKLVINVTSPPSDLRVLLDGVDVTVAINTELPIDLGPHEIVASAPGFIERKVATSVAEEGKTTKLDVALEPVPVTETVPPEKPPVEKPPVETPPETKPTPTPAAPQVVVIREDAGSSPGRTRKIVGVATMLVGGAAVGLGIKFGYDAQRKWDYAQIACGDDLVCDSNPQYVDAADYVDEARTNAGLSTGFVIGGAAAIAGGLILVLTAPSGTSASGLRVEPGAAGTPMGLTVGGLF